MIYSTFVCISSSMHDIRSILCCLVVGHTQGTTNVTQPYPTADDEHKQSKWDGRICFKYYRGELKSPSVTQKDIRTGNILNCSILSETTRGHRYKETMITAGSRRASGLYMQACAADTTGLINAQHKFRAQKSYLRK